MRGRESGARARLRLARRRLAGGTRAAAVAGAALALAVGGFVFYNTNVLNAYESSGDAKARRADYERRYRRFERAPQPQLVATALRIELHPARREATLRGTHRLVNRGAAPIDSVLVAVAGGAVETRALTFDRPAALVRNDARLDTRLYALAEPLAPGDTLRIAFDVRVAPHGFGERGVDPSLSPGGSAFTGAAWLPFVGYRRQRELITASDRREHALPPRPVIASLAGGEEGETDARGGGIMLRTIVGTDEDQVAVAPGALRRTWTEGGRRWFDYGTDAPIGDEWSFFSARYAVREERWTPPPGAAGRPVVLRVFHAPEHTRHLDRTLRSVRASMDYFSAALGPYPYGHLTIVEHPGRTGTGLHADAAMISHGEGFPLWSPSDAAGTLDFPYAVVAHEMGHQWGVPYAPVEGAPFMSEGLAWYGAMQVVKASRGEAELRRLLARMRQPSPYPPIRRGEPLLRALDPYLSYRKGPFAMYALSEYLAADRVNGALRRLLAAHDAPGAPLATTLDLYRELRAVTPDSLRYLLHDLFEVNTYWRLETRRAVAARVADGTWRVTLDVRARKSVFDSAGVEREVPMHDLVEIGVFAESNAGEQWAPLHLRLHRIRPGTQTITLTVPRRPSRAGVDPRNLLIDQVPDDNTVTVAIDR